MDTITNVRIDVVCDASGNFSGKSFPVNGRILQVRYTPDSITPLATGADLAISGNESGVNVLTQANIGTVAFTSVPGQPVNNASDGSPALFASGGNPLLDYVFVAGERLLLTIAQGGNLGAGRFDIWVG